MNVKLHSHENQGQSSPSQVGRRRKGGRPSPRARQESESRAPAFPHELPPEPEAAEIVRALRLGEVDAVVVTESEQTDKILKLMPAPSSDDVEQIVNAIRRGEVDAFVVHGSDGDQIYTLSAIEKSLRESEQRFRQLADSMPCIVWSANADGAVDYYNSQWRQFTCVEAGQTPDLVSVLHDDDREKFMRAWSQSIRDCMPMEIEVRFKCSTPGGHIWQLVRAVPVQGDDGCVKQWFGTCTDVDAIKRAQQELDRHRDHLEKLVSERTHALKDSHERLRLSERMAALGTLSAGLGHDMANLLLPIQMRLDALERQPLTEQASVDIKAIRECAEYLKRLVVGLRTFALDPMQMSAGTATDLSEWWTQAGPLLSIVMPRGASLSGEFSPELPRVKVSSAALTQAVFNLVQNATVAVAQVPKGHILVKASRAGNDAFVTLEVSDNGAGMSPEVLQHCFEPFFTTKTGQFSTGLGLALVQGIVRHVGGELSVESEVGHGSRFQIRLPVAARASSDIDGGTPQAVVSIADHRMKSYVVSLLARNAVKYREQSSVDPNDGEALLWIADQDPQPHANVEAFLNGNARRTMILTVPDGIDHERVLHVNGFSPKGLRDAVNAAIARSRGEGAPASAPA